MVEYEFTEIQNGIIGDLAKKMRFVAVMGMVVGLILGGGGISSFVFGRGGGGPAIANVIMGASSFFVGAWTRSAASAFENIVKTQGHDIGNLMAALGELRRVYAFQRVLLIVVLLSLVLAVQLYFLFVAGHAR